MRKNQFRTLLIIFTSVFITFGCSKEDDKPESLVPESEQEQEQEEETSIEITVENFMTSVDENTALNTSLGTVSATTNQGTLIFEMNTQNPDGAVAINADTGELVIADETVFDYEMNTEVTGSVTAKVDDTSKTLNFTIEINDVEDSTLSISSSNEFMIDENSETGTVIGTVTASTDSSEELIYSIENVSLEGAIMIDAATGEITVVDADKFDFETVQEITATVNVALGNTLNATQDIIISIVDVIEPLTVSTFAGSTEGYVDGDISVATFDRPTGMAIDSNGNIYVTEYGNHTVRKITPQGMVSTLAGGFNGFQDGTGTDARLFRPSDIIMGNDGFLYVADTWNNRIRKISLDGVVTTVAGSTAGFAEGTGTAARFNRPTGLTMDASGNIYVTDLENQRIRKITSTGVVSTLAGGTEGFDDGIGSAAQFKDPTGITINSDNELLVTDYFGRTIRKITLNGAVTTYAGSGISGSFDRTRANSSFGTPFGIAIDNEGDILVSDWTHDNIRKISTVVDEVTTVAGESNTGGGASGNIDGLTADARFNNPAGIMVASDGTIYIADYDNHSIRVIK